MRDCERVDGWKAIGAHFGRDRTTAIRWAQDRGLPVHFIPGGKTRTVYALKAELDAWARRRKEGEPAGPTHAADPAPSQTVEREAPPPGPERPNLRRRPAAMALVGALALLGGSAYVLAPARAPTSSTALPADPATAQLLVQAREDWAERTAPSLGRAIAELQQVTRRAPGFAPAFADLADAYVLAREAGSLSDGIAFVRAQDAAERARALDPTLPAAYRALGFVAYWWSHDREGAARAFREALRLGPDDAQTHFWYANVLADNGEEEPAMREFAMARLADPGSPQVGADYAWALWSAGHGEEAMGRLRAIAAEEPDVAEAHDCLATMLLSAGDVRGYLDERHRLERLRGQPPAMRLDAVLAAGGAAALLRERLGEEMASQAGVPYPDHSEAAFLASLSGDRPALLRILATADRLREQWGSAGMVRRIALRWHGDRAVEAGLDRLRAPAIDPLVRSEGMHTARSHILRQIATWRGPR